MKPTNQKKLPAFVEVIATDPKLKQAIEEKLAEDIGVDPEPKICSVCGQSFVGFGNNAWPINTGVCCDPCNGIVVSHRMMNAVRGKGAYAEPEWYGELVKEIQTKMLV